jgi:hypothetical protein
MTLDELLHQKLTEWHPPPGRQELSLTDPASPWTVALIADRQESLGTLVWELAVRRTETTVAGDLRTWAERIADRVTGLVEPLAVLEIDTLRQEALLRSETPMQRAEDLFYHEVFLKGTSEAVLRRYRASHQAAQRREQVGFALSHEAITNLVKQLTAAK